MRGSHLDLGSIWGLGCPMGSGGGVLWGLRGSHWDLGVFYGVWGVLWG